MASRFASVTEKQILSIMVSENFKPKSRDFMRAKENREAKFQLFIACICCNIVANKPNFGSADWLWYILKQLFTSVSVKAVDIYLHFGN